MKRRNLTTFIPRGKALIEITKSSSPVLSFLRNVFGKVTSIYCLHTGGVFRMPRIVYLCRSTPFPKCL